MPTLGSVAPGCNGAATDPTDIRDWANECRRGDVMSV